MHQAAGNLDPLCIRNTRSLVLLQRLTVCCKDHQYAQQEENNNYNYRSMVVIFLLLGVLMILTAYREPLQQNQRSRVSYAKRIQVPSCLVHWKYASNSSGHVYNPESCQYPIPYVAHKQREHLTHHFPHFAQMYFHFISEMLSPSITRCTTYVVLRSNSKLAQALRMKKPMVWIDGLITALNRVVDHSTIDIEHEQVSYPTTPPPSLSFYHAADATILTSVVLGSSPCPKGHKSAAPKLNLLILQRQGTRKIANVIEILHGLQTNLSDFIDSSVSVVTTETSFRDQVALFHSVDIVLSPHGAGLSNIAFMKPCSVLLEIFPYAFSINMYENLARSVDLGYISWMEPLQNSIFTQKRKPYCLEQLGRVSEESPMNISRSCFHSAECRRCFRDPEKIILTATIAGTEVRNAIKYVKKCSEHHIFYRRE